VQLEEIMVEQDVSVGKLHTQDHIAFSSVEPSNKNGEIVPFLLIDGSAPSSGLDFEKKVNNKNVNVRSFSIEENDENVEEKIVKTESEERKEPNVDAVGYGAVYIKGAGAEIDEESDSDNDVYEDANYYDSDSEYINMAKINELTGKIRLPGDLVARAADKSIRDSIMGNMVWQYKSSTCPQGLTQLFRGLIKIYSNDTANFVEAVAILEDRGQVAGLELKEAVFLCYLPAYKTHLRDVIHPDNFTSVVVDPFDPEHITDYIRLQSELSFLHVKSSISQKDKLRQVCTAICETRRQIAATRLESIAGCDNPYSLLQVFGRGYLASKAGATVYVTRCRPVSVTPRTVVNCTAEIPAHYNESEVFIDPISYVIKSYGTPMKCTDIALPRFQIGSRWYCLIAQRGLSECHQPLALPIAAVEIDHEEPEPWGLGRSIYSEAQLAAFAEFQQAAAVRAAYVADVSELAYSRRGPDGEWGLPSGTKGY
jgi:hypothetical protein